MTKYCGISRYCRSCYIYIKISIKKRRIRKGELLLEGLLKPSFYIIPVDHVPPSCYIVCAAVLVLEIVSMFPYDKAHQWNKFFCLPFCPRACLVRHGYELDAFCILVIYEPAPAASLYCHRIL